MAYAFKQSSGVAGQVRDMATEQIDKALEAIAANEDFDQTVHTLRKSCKKLRALLKLVRPVFDGYEAENDAFRAIADRFSVARDAAVMVQTMLTLVNQSGVRLKVDGVGSVTLLDRLRERARHLRQQMGEEELLALAAADVGIAMGTGTDVAMESAGVTLLKGDLTGIVRARRLSEAVMRNIRQNLFFAFIYNALGVPVAAGVLYPFFDILLSPIIAAAAMALSSVSVIANASRLRVTRL